MITVDEVLDLYLTGQKDFGSTYAGFNKDDKLYELAFGGELGLPEEYKAQGVVLPTARDAVDTFADYINIDNARVFISRKKDNDTATEAAEELRKFGQGIIYLTNVNAAISPWRVAAKHYPLYGVAWLKTVYNADLWPDKPTQKNGESDEAYAERLSEWEGMAAGTLPISISAVNPKCIMFDRGTLGQTWVIEHYTRPVNEIIRRYKKWDRGKYSGTEMVPVIDYWDKDYRCVIVDDQPVLNTKNGLAKHGYGFVPFVCIDAGLGNVTEDNDMSKRFVGLNRYIEKVLISQSRDYSIQDVIISNGGFPSGMLIGEHAMEVEDFKMGYGTWTRLPPGVQPKEFENAMAPSEVTQHFYTTSEIIDGHAIPRSLRGQSESGVRSGSDRRQLMGAAQYRLRYSEMAFKNRTALVLNNCARLLSKIPGNVTVWSHTPSDEFYDVIDKKKIKEPINYHVEFAPVSEEDEYRRHDDFERLVQSGIVTRTWARKQMSNVSVPDLEKQELKERIRSLPAMAEGVNALVGAMINKAVNQVMAAEGLTPPAGPPPPGQEGTPQPPQQGGMVTQNRNAAQPGSPGAMQNLLTGMRSQTPMNPTQGRSPFAGGSVNHPQR